MKTMKKFAALALSLILALALAIPAMATSGESTDGYTLTIKGVGTGYTYVAYQIFSGDLAEENGNKVLSNIQWGSGVDQATIDGFTFGEDEDGNKISGAKDIAQYLSDNSSEDLAKEFAEAISGYLADATATQGTCDDEYVYTMSGLPAGYYLVQNSAVPTDGEGTAIDTAYTSNILEVVSNTTVHQKGTVPSSDKKIVVQKPYTKAEMDAITGENVVETNEASIGDDVEYQITGTLPSNYADYKTYYYEFTDTLSKGLSVKEDSFAVTVYNGTVPTDITDYFWTVVNENEDGTTTIQVGIEDLKAFDNVSDVTVNADSKIVVTYTATLNENAVMADEGGNENTVYLTYSNNPNNSGTPSTTPPPEEPTRPERGPEHPTGETPESTVTTYTTQLTITKVDGNNGEFLPGTQFKLTGESMNIVLVTSDIFREVTAGTGTHWLLNDGTYTTEAPAPEHEVDDVDSDGNPIKVTVPSNEDDYASLTADYVKETALTAKGEGQETVDVIGTIQDDGTVTFKGLGAGNYTLHEEYTLPGYNTVDDINFEISFDENTETFSMTNTDTGAHISDGLVLATTIENFSGSTLPETGGIGTTIFYIVGGVLVVGAAVLLITKKRMGSN